MSRVRGALGSLRCPPYLCDSARANHESGPRRSAPPRLRPTQKMIRSRRRRSLQPRRAVRRTLSLQPRRAVRRLHLIGGVQKMIRSRRRRKLKGAQRLRWMSDNLIQCWPCLRLAVLDASGVLAVLEAGRRLMRATPWPCLRLVVLDASDALAVLEAGRRLMRATPWPALRLAVLDASVLEAGRCLMRTYWGFIYESSPSLPRVQHGTHMHTCKRIHAHTHTQTHAHANVRMLMRAYACNRTADGHFGQDPVERFGSLLSCNAVEDPAVFAFLQQVGPLNMSVPAHA